jgi:hypothetical protein
MGNEPAMFDGPVGSTTEVTSTGLVHLDRTGHLTNNWSARDLISASC